MFGVTWDGEGSVYMHGACEVVFAGGMMEVNQCIRVWSVGGEGTRGPVVLPPLRSWWV